VTAIALRLAIYVIIVAAVYFGIRKIWRDWKSQFRNLDREQHERDLRERDRPDVITLKRDGDGVFRPNGKDDDQAGPRA